MEKIKILGIPFDYGQGHIGTRSAFDSLMEQGLDSDLSRITSVENLGKLDIPFKVQEVYKSAIKYRSECSRFNHAISEKINTLNLSSSFLLNIGGDHGIALGTVHAMLLHDPETIVVWADAHGDINIPECSPSGNFHGMPLAFLLGLAKDDAFSWITRKLIPKNLIFFGPRDLDPWEKDIIRILGIHYFSSEQINLHGAKELIDIALEKIDPLGERPIHLSFDVDLFDGNDIKSTGTRVCHGPRMEEVFLMGGVLAETGRLRSMDLVEFNPQIGNIEEVAASSEIILKFIASTMEQVFAPSKNGQIEGALTVRQEFLSRCFN